MTRRSDGLSPEDSGGIGGYDELAVWVRSGYDEELLPDVFDNATDTRSWMPLDWHPDHYDLGEVNTILSTSG